MHDGTVFCTAVPGDSPRRIGSRYGTVSLASQSRDTVPYPETLPSDIDTPFSEVSLLGDENCQGS